MSLEQRALGVELRRDLSPGPPRESSLGGCGPGPNRGAPPLLERDLGGRGRGSCRTSLAVGGRWPSADLVGWPSDLSPQASEVPESKAGVRGKCASMSGGAGVTPEGAPPSKGGGAGERVAHTPCFDHRVEGPKNPPNQPLESPKTRPLSGFLVEYT